ncbi:hypothetical protein [Burkholderia multivorans]|uniref:hypothetical protein n=1 Tax=Burkholderia multivorans TaxID=87883 RepID=UPI001903225F|nr:hypothetical protein [Burkholderia multivorans]MBJ9621340.1 hypothetical protein [Burkholderia multivorans]
MAPLALLLPLLMSLMTNAERRTPNAERRTPNAERRTPTIRTPADREPARAARPT